LKALTEAPTDEEIRLTCLQFSDMPIVPRSPILKT
jgi:hypothetical protein